MTRARCWLALLLAGCAGPSGPTSLDGRSWAPLVIPPGAVHVLVFTSQECPIANSYAPTLRELAASWRGLPVLLFLVHVDPDLTVAAARQHAEQYQLPGTVLLDPEQKLAATLGITRTPEAVVCTSAGTVYRGRIDDQWRELGARAPEASRHDLADAVAKALAGDPIEPPWPPAVGCLLPEPGR